MSDHDGKNLPNFSFGYGGRMCVASHLATRAMYIALLQIIANYKILRGDDAGLDLGPDTADIFVDPVKGVRDPSATAGRPNLVPLRFVPRNAAKLEARLQSSTSYGN